LLYELHTTTIDNSHAFLAPTIMKDTSSLSKILVKYFYIYLSHPSSIIIRSIPGVNQARFDSSYYEVCILSKMHSSSHNQSIAVEEVFELLYLNL